MMIVVRPCHNTSTDIVHLPVDEDTTEPKCGQGSIRDREWIRKDKSVYPNARICRCCQGDHGDKATQDLSYYQALVEAGGCGE